MSRIERTCDKYQRQKYKKEFMRELKLADESPPEALFDNITDLLEWLNAENPDKT
jgi:hypothetical protein